MKNYLQKILATIGLFTLGGVAMFFFLANKDEPNIEKKRYLEEKAVLVSPPIPPRIDFAGENVPVDDVLIREDLEQHLLVNMYSYPAAMLMLKRAHRWQDTMTVILRQNGIPEDFFYLMVAESGVRNIKSWAGANGYWQFMPETAKQYGLEVNDYIDERLDPILSTHAACRYLNKAYQRFGNWTLVAASYNMGMGGVNKQMTWQKANNYYDLYLNQETAEYLFRIISIKMVQKDPKSFGFKLYPEDLYKPIPHKVVEVQGGIPSLVDFAHSHGTNYKLLRRMNPWLLGSSLPARSTPYQLRITTPDQLRTASMLQD
jgi:hypothetical protein